MGEEMIREEDRYVLVNEGEVAGEFERDSVTGYFKIIEK